MRSRRLDSSLLGVAVLTSVHHRHREMDGEPATNAIVSSADSRRSPAGTRVSKARRTALLRLVPHVDEGEVVQVDAHKQEVVVQQRGGGSALIQRD